MICSFATSCLLNQVDASPLERTCGKSLLPDSSVAINQINLSEVTAPTPGSLDSIAVDKIIAELARLKKEINAAQVNGETGANYAQNKADYEKKFNQLVQLGAQDSLLTRDRIVELIKKKIAETSHSAKSATTAENNSKEQLRKTVESIRVARLGTEIIFRKVNTESDDTINLMNWKRADTEFEVMETLVTRSNWSDVESMLNEPLDSSGKFSWELNDVKPVTGYSLREINEWIVALNKLSTQGDGRIRTIIPDWEIGDHFDFPRGYLWTFMVGDIARQFISPGSKLTVNEGILRFGYFAENSNGQLAAVHTSEAAEYHGVKIYDLLGGVVEYTTRQVGITPDTAGFRLVRTNGVPSQTSATRQNSQQTIELRGLCYKDSYKNAHLQLIGAKRNESEIPDECRGFRLVRTRASTP